MTEENWLKDIETKGYIEVTDFFPRELISKINAIIERPFHIPTVNGRNGYIQFSNTRFLKHALSWGREVLDLYTYPKLISLADKFTGGEVHLSNYRIYRSYPADKGKMAWHVDNKIDTFDTETEDFKTHVVTKDRGLILILYLSDVEDGGLQIVEGSHVWSVNEDRENWDAEEPKFADKIITFNNRKSGTAIIYDYRCIHRAKPYRNGELRTSLFGQFSPSWMPTGEPVIVCARDLDNLSPLQRRVLNFGKNPTTENWPIGGPEELLPALGLQLKGPGFSDLFRRLRRRLAMGLALCLAPSLYADGQTHVEGIKQSSEINSKRGKSKVVPFFKPGLGTRQYRVIKEGSEEDRSSEGESDREPASTDTETER